MNKIRKFMVAILVVAFVFTGTNNSVTYNSAYGSWAKVKLTASGSSGSGRGAVSNEF